MATAPKSKKRRPAGGPVDAARPDRPGGGDDVLRRPHAGMVLHRVLAQAARTFLLNDMDDELVDAPGPRRGLDALDLRAGRPTRCGPSRPPSRSTARSDGPARSERVHQSRVAMRRIRSNLRTFRLAVDPAWGTSLRAELAWYGGRLGQVRDLHILSDIVAIKGPEVLDPERGGPPRLGAGDAHGRGPGRHGRRAGRGPAVPAHRADDGAVGRAGVQGQGEQAGRARSCRRMLHRAWHDLRGAARAARKETTDVNLHKLRIRLKDLRYGCETVALVEGGPARKTARAAERLQGKLGDLHDACLLDRLVRAAGPRAPRPARAVGGLVDVQREAAAGPQGMEARPQGGRAPLAALAGLSPSPRWRRPAVDRGECPAPGYPTTSLTARWSPSHSLIPPRMPAVLSTMVTSSARLWRATRRELPPPM